MNNKWARRTLWLGGFCVAASLVAWVAWLPILTTLVIRHGAGFFRSNFQPDKDVHPIIISDEWATGFFAGTKGLPEVETLSRDQSLIPTGRAIAGDLHRYISTGQHIPYLRWMVSEGARTWASRRYNEYLLKRDIAYLKERGLPIPESVDLR
jgi:hypothetical protein